MKIDFTVSDRQFSQARGVINVVGYLAKGHRWQQAQKRLSYLDTYCAYVEDDSTVRGKLPPLHFFHEI